MTKIINDSVAEEDDKEELTATTSKYAHEPKRMMEDIIKSTPVPPEAGVLVEGTVIGKEKMSIYVDIPPFGTGIIYGREYLNAKDLIKKINLGDLVTAKIVEAEGEKGYIELSLKEAKQAIASLSERQYGRSRTDPLGARRAEPLAIPGHRRDEALTPGDSRSVA